MKTRKELGAHIFFVTSVCNSYCYMCCAPVIARNVKSHPPFNYIKNEIDKLKDIREIYLTGGEPSLSPDIFRIIDYIKEKNSKAKINIITNGRIFYYKDFSRKISNKGINKIVTEIHGPTPKIHDKITRSPGSFEQTVQGIKNLIDLNQKIELRIVVHKMNYKYLNATTHFILENLKGIDKVIIFPFNIVSHGLKNRNILQIRYKDIIPYIEKSVAELKTNNFPVELYHIPFCVIDKRYWGYIRGRTAEDYKITTTKECEKCFKKEKCPLVWKSYIKFNGDKEFKAIIPKRMEKFKSHKKIFNINENNYLVLFKDLLKKSKNSELECSCKMEDDRIFPTRFNIWYSKDFRKNKKLIFSFLKKMSKFEDFKVDRKTFKRIFEMINFDKIDNMIFGIDLRRKRKESRIKIWFITKGYLFGYDFYFDGRVLMKRYSKSIKSLDSRIKKMAKKCLYVYVSVKEGSDKVIHFHPIDKHAFFKEIVGFPYRISEKLHLIDKSNLVVSIPETELLDNNIKTINLYY